MAADLRAVLQNPGCKRYIKGHKLVQKRERAADRENSWVLRIVLADSSNALRLAREIESLGPFGCFGLYDVDLPPAQAYLYEKDLFLLAFCEVVEGRDGLRWSLMDDVESVEYGVPDLAIIELDARLKKQSMLPKFTDHLVGMTMKADGKEHEIAGNSEAEILRELEEHVDRLDPDIVLTEEGDWFLFPYLVTRASENGMSLSLGREKAAMKKPARDGTSYFSYGKIHFKPSSATPWGRVHIDSSNSFSIKETGMHGLYEVTPTCRMPLYTSSRAPMRTCLSSLQFYQAAKNDMLIPWKPDLAEHFKTYGELLVADRGSYIFEPRIGVFEGVAEFDFASLFPSIMYQKNISAETVRCACCPDSKRRVPELDYNICEREGLVPKAIKIVIKKGKRYKELMKKVANAQVRELYDARQSALKWINIAAFGYLSFNNAKFGSIGAHIAVCAFARTLFLQATRIVESHGFSVLHGIVDSLWLYKKGATEGDYARLKDAIEKETEFSILFEGVYKWIAFLQSRQNGELPAADRYFGAFYDGSLKIRGIEARSHDTPPLFAKFQHEILETMARGGDIAEVRSLMGHVQQAFDMYASLIKSDNVPAADLVFTKYLSKDAGQYLDRDTEENYSMSQLVDEGKSLKAGQALRYFISDHARRRTVPIEFVDENTVIDAGRYVELLAESCNSITGPFGFRIDLHCKTNTLDLDKDIENGTKVLSL